MFSSSRSALLLQNTAKLFAYLLFAILLQNHFVTERLRSGVTLIVLSKRRHRSAHFEENMKPNYDSSHFSFLFLQKIILNRVISYILVIIKFCVSMAPCKTVYTLKY